MRCLRESIMFTLSEAVPCGESNHSSILLVTSTISRSGRWIGSFSKPARAISSLFARTALLRVQGPCPAPRFALLRGLCSAAVLSSCLATGVAAQPQEYGHAPFTDSARIVDGDTFDLVHAGARSSAVRARRIRIEGVDACRATPDDQPSWFHLAVRCDRDELVDRAN